LGTAQCDLNWPFDDCPEHHSRPEKTDDVRDIQRRELKFFLFSINIGWLITDGESADGEPGGIHSYWIEV
jgi:hypothetical protein